jgi:hypothetical protein
MAQLEIGGLAAVGEADPEAQVVVGELSSRVNAVAEHVEGAKVALLPRDDLTQAQVQGAAEPGRVGPDAGQPDRPLGGAGQNELDRDDPRDHVGGRLDPGRPTVLNLGRLLRQLRRLRPRHQPILTHATRALDRTRWKAKD